MNAHHEHSSGEKVYQIVPMLIEDWGGINGVLPRSGLVQGMLYAEKMGVFSNR